MNLTRFLTRATLLALLFVSTSLAQAQVTKPDPPKSDDAARVGLVTPRVSLLGGGGSVPQETNSLRQNLSSFLTGPRIGTIDIRAKLDSLALEEAKERGCDYVLYVALTRKRPAAARGSGGSFGGGTKTGDEFTFEFKVVAVAGTQGTVERTLKGTASSDGQDVVTAMIETAAQVVVELARQAKPAVAETKVNSDQGIQSKSPAPAAASAEPAPEPIPTGYGSLSATPKSSSTTSRTNDPPKGEGVIRIGVVTPRVMSTGSGIGGNSEANSLRTTFNSFLAGSNIETIDLKARLEGLAITEAQRRQCDFVLYTTLVRKRAGSSSGGSGPMSSIMGNAGGGGGVGTKIPGSKTVKDVTSEAARVSSTLASFARANDEVTFEYKLVSSAGAKPVAGKSTKAKVKNDGEDVLTPMIESAAQAIVDATIKP
ncbi:MAG TPA: hypothetical protein VFS76_19045 [Pyrinomonadaceae bacterium]|nr:hypothetical protein [Pyrinomonadaceae bacterium]